MVPSTPRTNTPRITDGEIWDIEVVGNRVFVVGSFTSSATTRPATRPDYNQRHLVAFNLETGLVDATFRPTFDGGGVDAVEASPDGTKLFVAGTFNTINGVTKRKIARINPTTGAPVAGFTANANAQAPRSAVTNTTVYLGGQVHHDQRHRPRSAWPRSTPTPAPVDTGFVNNHHRRHRRQRRAHRAGAHAHPRRHARWSSSTPDARSTARTATASA